MRFAKIQYPVIGPLFLKTTAEGAATQVHVAAHSVAAGISARYFADCNIAASRPYADDPLLAQRLWDVSEEIARTV